MKQIIKNIKLLSIFLLIISFSACEEEDVVLPSVKAGFTYTVNQEIGLVKFINISENADRYEWDFGDGNTSTEVNPTKTYETGEYTVTLKATHASGASETFEDKVYINIPVPVRLPISFDEANVKYDEVTLFNGTAFEVVDNPDVGGANATASKVGKLTNSGANWEGFFYDLDASVDLTTDKTIKMKVWAETSVPVLLKLEEGSAAAIEMAVTHGGTGWEELIFTFDSAASYNRLTVFVDGPGNSAGSFYFDDIMQTETVDVTAPVISLNGDASMSVNQGATFTDPGATATDNVDGDISANIVVGGDTVDTSTLGTYTITYNVSDAAGNAATEVSRTVEVTEVTCVPETTENIDVASDNFNWTFQTGDHSFDAFGNIAAEIVDNPSLTEGNMSCKVQKVTKSPGCETWSGVGTEIPTAIDLTSFSDKVFKMKVYAENQTTSVTLRLERLPHPNVDPAVEKVAEITEVGVWQELTFDFSDITTGTYKSMIVYFERNAACDGDVYYFDDLKAGKNTSGGGGGGGTSGCTGTPVDATSLPVNFETCESFISTFTGASTMTTELAENPNKAGINTSDYVLKAVKGAGANRWAGFQNVFANNFDLSSSTTFKFKVYSSKANTTFRFELSADPVPSMAGLPAPVFVEVPNANEWTEVSVTFNIAGLPNITDQDFNKLVIKPDNPDGTDGETTASEETYYIDDIIQE